MITNNLENKIIQGDCQEVMQQIESNSIDCIVTDPPYGYSFMGKDWDKTVPRVAIWKECLRVLKPGAFAFVMSSPRADVLSHMIVNLGDAGFRTDFTPIYWAYASGFPKAMNIGKMVDKKLGGHGVLVNQKTYPDIRANNYSNSQGKTRLCGGDYSPEKPEAKALNGSFGGFQPKPAVEIIIVCMKPLSEKTFVDQALTNGKGVTWLDKCRVPINPDVDASQLRTMNRSQKDSDDGWGMNNNQSDNPQVVRPDGRFPANLLVSDNCLDNGEITKSQGGLTKNEPNSANIYGKYKQVETIKPMDKGQFSRYFSLDAWWANQITKLPPQVQQTFPFIIEPKASKTERNTNLDKLPIKDAPIGNYEGRDLSNSKNVLRKGMQNRKVRNFHPTVKPLQLMSYLITLGSRPNDLILDPFVGSGTTCLAAKMLGRRFLGIELNVEYVKIAETRVNNHRTLFEFSTPEVCV